MSKHWMYIASILALTIGIMTPSGLAINQVLSLDGDGDWVELTDFVVPETFTVEMQVNPNSIHDGQNFIGKHTINGGNIFVLGYYDGGLYVLIRSALHTEGEKITGFHHLAVVVEKITPTRSDVTVYRNGSLLWQATLPDTIGNTDGKPWVFGQDWDGESLTDFFNGFIDDIRFWGSARTQEVIQAAMNTTLSGNEPGLIGYWNFDDGAARDLSLNGNDGTLNGGASIIDPERVFQGVFFPEGELSFADTVVAYNPVIKNGEPHEKFANPSKALGAPDFDNVNAPSYVSLGDGGSITVQFTDNSLTGSDDDAGDLRIFEVGPDVEDTFVEISRDGVEWVKVGKVYGGISTIDLDAFGFGSTDFFSYVRLTDDPDEGGQFGGTVGADIDAIGAIFSSTVVINDGTTVPPTSTFTGGEQIAKVLAPVLPDQERHESREIRKIYWTDIGTYKIQRANPDGSNIETLLTGVRAWVLALDIPGDKMYWVNWSSGLVRRANLDGTNIETLVTGVSRVEGIALDLRARKMYWTLPGKIQRANLDGSSIETLIDQLSKPDSIALDVAGGKMYWTDVNMNKIQRANFDGSNIEDLVTYDMYFPQGLNLDLTGGKMYWTNWPPVDKIQRANLDGSNVEDLASGLGGLEGLALYVDAGKMYWTDFNIDKIQRANFDGSDIEDVVTTGLNYPLGITLDIRHKPRTAAEYLWSVPAGISLIHVPLKVTAVDDMPQTITSIGDLYDALGGGDTVNFLITYDSSTQEWLSYFVPSDKGTPADRELTDDTGIIAGMQGPVSIRLSGDTLGTNGSSTITLNPGLNVVGLPLNDSRVTRVSDLFALDGIGGNVPVIILTDGGEFKLVGRADDPGDIEITGGQSFILTASREAAVDISGDAWTNVSGTAAAPPVTLKGIEVGDTTPVLALRGSIVDQEAGLKVEGCRVTVKNLSTDRKFTTVTAPDEAGYRLTVVDTETGQAATIGDTLEISAQSPNPFIGVQPLRYTVTAEDVKRSLIQLPELVVYEIPAETQLLSNYPNPFNPETWIPYRLAEDAFVTLTVYDQTGQVVRALNMGHQAAAVYESRSKAVYWDGRNEFGESVASGVYFYHLSAGDYSNTRKMVILK